MKPHQKLKPRFKFDEITIAVIVILVASAVSIHYKSLPKTSEAEKIAEMITDDHGVSFASGGVIDENKLKEVKKINYADLRKSINAKDDFCIYLEDGNGNIILAKGSSALNNDGLHCTD